MKKILLTVVAIVAISTTNAQIVNIPDANFKAYLVGNAAINTNADTEIQVSEATAYTGWINCPNLSISDLTGIEYFTSATQLYCNNNQISSLDLTNNSALTVIWCGANPLLSIDVSNNTALQDFRCINNQLTTLDVSNNTALTLLYCNNNQLTSLNMKNTNNSNLTSINATNNPNLTCIEVDDSLYSATNWTGGSFSFDLASSFNEDCNACIVTIPDANFKTYLVGNTSINTNGDTEIQCYEAQSFTGGIDCPNLSITDLTGIEAFTGITSLVCNNNQLTSLNLSNNTALVDVYCYLNQLTSLDVSQNTALEILLCQVNQLTSLDVSQNSALGFLNCTANLLTDLDVSQNLAMVQLQCYTNQLTSLDVSQNTALSILYCNHNQLSNLDVSQNSSLHWLWCQNNQLTALNVANGNNNNFMALRAEVNPNLACIEVDDVAYSTTNWTGGNFDFDPASSFSEDCSGTAGSNNMDQILVNVYPNPASTELYIEVSETTQIELLNMVGETVLTTILNHQKNTIDVSSLVSGVYFLQTENGASTKFIKK